jgi:hypothetical protein
MPIFRFFILFCLLAGIAFAQKVQFQSSGTVLFLPTDQEYAAAQGGGYLYAHASSPRIKLKVLRQALANAPYSVKVARTAWVPAADLVLEARYTISGNQSGTTIVDWFPIGTTPSTILTMTDPRIDVNVDIDYRIKIVGSDPPRPYTITVTYTGVNKNGVTDSSVSHDIRFDAPLTVSLRINNVVMPSTQATLYFDYSVDSMRYVQAIINNTPLSFTSSDFQKIEVFTNNPRGYRVVVSATLSSGPTSGSFNISKLRLKGTALNGKIFSNAVALEDYITLAIPQDFTAIVDGNESQGDYVFLVTYTATMNP